jgi:hypothetical protein
MVEVKQSKSTERKINDRLKPSNDMATAEVHVKKGEGPTRVSHTSHYSGQQQGPLGNRRGGGDSR